MSDYIKVASIDDIPLGKMRPFSVGYEDIIICHTETGFYAIANECTHDSAPIATDSTLKGDVIMCRRHGAKFNITNGNILNPPAVVNLETYKLKVDNGEISILLND